MTEGRQIQNEELTAGKERKERKEKTKNNSEISFSHLFCIHPSI
jgi:hypothetical protein